MKQMRIQDCKAFDHAAFKKLVHAQTSHIFFFVTYSFSPFDSSCTRK